VSETLYSVINALADFAGREAMLWIYGVVDIVVGFVLHSKIRQMRIDEMEGGVKTCGNLPVQ
jgi:hypothetical protein